jgi:hypothetical protein
MNPSFFANTGMYLCISPLTFTVLITSFLYAFNPQLKSCNLSPDVFLAAALNNLDGMFFVMTLS